MVIPSKRKGRVAKPNDEYDILSQNPDVTFTRSKHSRKYQLS